MPAIGKLDIHEKRVWQVFMFQSINLSSVVVQCLHVVSNNGDRILGDIHSSSNHYPNWTWFIVIATQMQNLQSNWTKKPGTSGHLNDPLYKPTIMQLCIVLCTDMSRAWWKIAVSPAR